MTRDDVLARLEYDGERGEFIWKRRSEHFCLDRAWNARFPGTVAGRLNSDGYRQIHICGRRYMAHRLVWLVETGAMPTGQIDHINIQKDDNRFDNLREASISQNGANRPAYRRKSGLRVKGAYPTKSGRWQSSIMVRGRQMCLGTFDTVDEASTAYRNAAIHHFGEFARAA